MKHTFITFILLSLCIFTYAQKKIAREYIEWSDIWIPGANKTDLPHVLLIGNSITRGYYGKVEAALKEKAYVGRLSNSKSVGDPALIEELAVVLKNTKFDVIHFNNGLHGFDYTEEEYDKSFPKLIKIIRKYAPKAKLIWANTTPVRAYFDNVYPEIGKEIDETGLLSDELGEKILQVADEFKDRAATN